MKYNAFNDPIPANYDELIEALDECEFNTDYCTAMIDYNAPDPDYPLFDGYSAEIRLIDEDDEDAEERSFTTAGYKNKSDLISDLRDARITNIESYS